MRILFGRAALFGFAVLLFSGFPDFAADGTPTVERHRLRRKISRETCACYAANRRPVLTEREQWMLDRIEQLEKSVAELESKGSWRNRGKFCQRRLRHGFRARLRSTRNCRCNCPACRLGLVI